MKVDRVLKDGDTVTLGGTTLRAIWAPGHTPGCTVWTTTVPDAGRKYDVAIFGCGGPNGGVKLVGNQRFPTLVDDTMTTFRKLKTLKPDIYVSGHPQMFFAGKIDRMKTNERPHPLSIRIQGWGKMLDEAEGTSRNACRPTCARAIGTHLFATKGAGDGVNQHRESRGRRSPGRTGGQCI